MTANTILVDMPMRVKGYTIENEDGTYSIFLNARMSSNQIAKTFRHEMEHINHSDFEKEHVQRVELYAHRMND